MAPWTIIRSEDKQLARLNAMKLILNAVDYADRDPKVDFKPDPEIVIDGADEVDIMEAHLAKKGKFKR